LHGAPVPVSKCRQQSHAGRALAWLQANEHKEDANDQYRLSFATSRDHRPAIVQTRATARLRFRRSTLEIGIAGGTCDANEEVVGASDFRGERLSVAATSIFYIESNGFSDICRTALELRFSSTDALSAPYH